MLERLGHSNNITPINIGHSSNTTTNPYAHKYDDDDDDDDDDLFLGQVSVFVSALFLCLCAGHPGDVASQFVASMSQQH